MWHFNTLILSAIAIGVALAHPGGAPKQACEFLPLTHGNATANNETHPYALTFEKDSAPLTYKVTLRGAEDEDTFKGFLVQGRNENIPFGTFTVLDEFSSISQLLECKVAGDSITHKRITGNVNIVSFLWTAPEEIQGPVTFHFAVVKTMREFWVSAAEYSTNKNNL